MLLPQARTEGLIVRETKRGLLAYDLEQECVRHVGKLAARVWRHADGGRTLASLTAILELELGTPLDESLIQTALAELDAAALLLSPSEVGSTPVSGHHRCDSRDRPVLNPVRTQKERQGGG